MPKQRSKKESGAAISTRVDSAVVPSVGGCLWARQSSIVLRNVSMRNCSAQYGSGLGAQDSSVVVSNTILSQNGAVDAVARGGGAYLFKCSAVLVNVTASGNVLLSTGNLVGGGGLYFEQCSPVILRYVTAVGNTIGGGGGGYGGGYYLDSCSSVSIQASSAVGNTIGGSVSIQASSAVGNTIGGGGGGYGGGYSLDSCSSVSIQASSAVGNTIGGGGYGGGYSLARCSSVSIQSSSAVGNTISHGGGGGYHLTSCSSVSIQSSSAVGNTIGGRDGYGGGYVLNICSSVSIQASSVQNNQLSSGQGGGGCVLGGGPYFFQNVTFSNNFISGAGGGGALSMAGDSSITLSQCLVTQNAVSLYAGAIATSDSVRLFIVNSVVENNVASRLPSIVSFDYNNNALYTFINSIFIDSVSDGSSLLLLGRIEFMNNVFASTMPGTIFNIDSSANFFSFTFTSCSIGTYSLLPASTNNNQTRCLTCPFGAICNGADTITNGLRAQPNYFGVSTTNEVKFYPCPSGHCCNDRINGCSFDHCEGGRTGLLCGKCPPDMGLVFFGEHCALNSDCNKSTSWASVVIVLVALGIVIFLVVTTRRPSSGIYSVLLFFYQVLPLVKSTPWQATSPIITTVLTSVFAMSPSTGQSGGFGVCLFPSMTASQRLGARMLFQAVVLTVFFAQYLCHRALHRLPLPWFKTAPDGIHYLGAFIRFLTIAYTTLVLVPLQLLQCIEVSGRLVWWYDAEIRCFDPPWQKVAILAISVLSPLPIVCSLLMNRWKNSTSLSEWQLEFRRVLTNGFASKRCWWLGVSLMRRLTLVIAFTTVRDQAWAAVINTILCILFVVMNLRLQPFETLSTHKLETVSLTLLACLAASSSPALTRIQYGTVENISNAEILEWFQFACAVAPAVGFVVLVMVRELRARLFPPTSESSSEPRPLVQQNAFFLCSSCGLPYIDDSSEEWEFRATETATAIEIACPRCVQFC